MITLFENFNDKINIRPFIIEDNGVFKIPSFDFSRFSEWYVKNANSLVEIIDHAQKEFVLGAHKAFQFARDMLDSDVYLYSSISPKEIAYSFLKPITMDGIQKLIETSQSIAVLPYASTMHVSLV